MPSVAISRPGQSRLSRSAPSHAMRALETRLGMRLPTRTTRSVSPTEAGQRLLNAIGPRLDEVELEQGTLGDTRDEPAATVRITTHDHAINTVPWPRLLPLPKRHPDVHIESSVATG